MKICDYELCTACMACSNICPKNAITFNADASYKAVAAVDDNICVQCGACVRVCPVANEKKYNSSFACYAAGAQEGISIDGCSSAGVSAAFCDYVLQNGGVVFGAGYKNGEAVHICADTAEAAEALKGSKYVRSNINFAFREAKEKLASGKTVLFTGTPCQIAGLYGYLGEKPEKLITVDLICHGTPESEFLNRYLEEKGIGDYTEISFRQQDKYDLTVSRDGKVIFKQNAAFNPFYRAFYNNITLRGNCFSCKYASAYNRPADISIGDFWGIDREALKNPINGAVSVILVNTAKGAEFLAQTGIVCEERPLDEAIRGNAQLRAPSKENSDRKLFIENYEKGFIYAVNKTCVRKNIRQNKTSYIKQLIKSFIKKGLGR